MISVARGNRGITRDTPECGACAGSMGTHVAWLEGIRDGGERISCRTSDPRGFLATESRTSGATRIFHMGPGMLFWTASTEPLRWGRLHRVAVDWMEIDRWLR